MTDDELDDTYFKAFNENWCKTGRGDSSDSAGLRAVAEAADRAAVRRTLDELRTFVEALDLGSWDRMAFLEKCGEMREGLE